MLSLWIDNARAKSGAVDFQNPRRNYSLKRVLDKTKEFIATLKKNGNKVVETNIKNNLFGNNLLLVSRNITWHNQSYIGRHVIPNSYHSKLFCRRFLTQSIHKPVISKLIIGKIL